MCVCSLLDHQLMEVWGLCLIKPQLSFLFSDRPSLRSLVSRVIYNNRHITAITACCYGDSTCHMEVCCLWHCEQKLNYACVHTQVTQVTLSIFWGHLAGGRFSWSHVSGHVTLKWHWQWTAAQHDSLNDASCLLLKHGWSLCLRLCFTMRTDSLAVR